MQYFHANLPVTDDFNNGATTPLSGGDIPGWGQLRGVCLRTTYEESGTYLYMQTVIRNQSGGSMSVAALDNEMNDQQYGQEKPDGETAIIAFQALAGADDTGFPPTAGGGASVVRRIDRKFAAFRVVDRLQGDHCEFDISMVLEP